jgi:hypothetical protein
VSQLQQQLQETQRSVAARDAEVSRLGARLGAGGPDVDSLSRDQRGDAYDTIVLSLNKQVRQGWCVVMWWCWGDSTACTPATSVTHNHAQAQQADAHAVGLVPAASGYKSGCAH